MRVLQVATLSKFFEWFLLPLATRLREDGAVVDGLARYASIDKRSAPYFDRLHDASWSRHPLDLKGILPMLRRVDRVVEQGRYDIVHVHTPVAAFYTRIALRAQRRRRGVKVVYTAHGFHFHRNGSPVKNAVFLLAEKVAGCWTDALVVINRDDQRAARRFRIVPEDRLFYMSGIGVDTSAFDPAAVPDSDVRRLREALGVACDVPLLLCIAELIPRKRHGDLLAAFAATQARNARLLLAGEGPLRARLEEQAEELGIAGRVHFLGHRHDVPVLIKAASAVVLVSAQEGLPRCLLEALSMERPVIATAIRGSSELVDGAGLLAPVGDIERITAAIEQVLANRDGMAPALREARARMVREHDQQLILDQYVELFARLARNDQ